MVVVYLFGGALADRMDRRRILLSAQARDRGLRGHLAALAFAGHPPVWAIFILAALLAGFGVAGPAGALVDDRLGLGRVAALGDHLRLRA